MGIILINRVVGVDDGRVQMVGQGVGHPECGKLALGVDYVRPPVEQLTEQAPGAVDPQAGARIDAVRADGTHVIDIAVFIRVHGVGQSDHPDLMAPGLQLALEQQHGGHHAVDDWSIPVRCYQNLHMTPSETSFFFGRDRVSRPSGPFIIANPARRGKRYFKT